MSEHPAPTPGLNGVDASALLAALGRAAAPLALVDGAGTVLWCSAAFADAVGADSADALAGSSINQTLGLSCAALPDGAAQAPLELELVDRQGLRSAWCACTSTLGADQHLLSLQRSPQQDARLAALQERLDLVQEFSRAGIFERDPVTMEGNWDEHLYRIYGMPLPPAGTLAPPLAESMKLILPEDRTAGGFVASLAEPGVHASRVRIRRPDGSLRHIHSQWKVFHDEQGRATRVLGVNTDVTEAFELAQQAELLREELSVALSLGNVALWRHDLSSGRVQFDARGYGLIGVEPRPEGLTVEQARALLHPDDVAKAVASAAATLRSGAASDMSLRYPDAQGGWRHVLARRVLQRDAQGQPLAFVGVLLDETERVEQTRKTLELAQRLEAAAEAARIGLWSSLVGGAAPSWNRRMFELCGLDPAQGALPLGEWLRRCVHASDRDRVAERVTHWVREGSGPIEIEFRVVRPADQVVRWLVVRGDLDLKVPAGQRRIEGVAIDVTEQHQTLRQLRDNLERAALTTSALGLGTWESHGPEDQIVWDEQMFRLRGVSSPRRAVSRAEIASYLHADEREAVMAGQIQRLAEGQAWSSEFRVVWPDGRLRWIASRSMPRLGDEGTDVRCIGLNFDVTDAKMAEQALRERALAVAESRAKSRFMSRISHELRTPLNAVLGFTQLLRGDADEATRRRWLDHVDAAGRHLLALIDDVLDLTRLDAGDMRVELQPVQLAEAVQAALALVARSAQERGVQLCEPGALPGVVLADPVRLRQVLLNLLSNAIKYNRPGGQVRLASRVHDGLVTLQVADTGIGIEPERLRRVFEPFDRLGAESSAIEGTGIGLAIAKALVEQMGGRIDVDSVADQGTTFAVSLPAAGDAAAPQPPQPPTLPKQADACATTPASPRVARLLYIEDNAVNALLVRELLAPKPTLALEIAEDGASGIARARASRPDLVLIDMQLPDMDGPAVLRALQADPATAGIPCVALSANAIASDIQAALAAGFVDYWTKPIDFERFLADLAKRLGRPI